ncbi:DUF1441 family protein [Roseibium sp.]|uniref:DUF1441 family protein n=1 Tax=Roseibium sp. TaxID=1936156 RepID=UPI003BAAF2B6
MPNAIQNIAEELTSDRPEDEARRVADLLEAYPVPPGWLDEVFNRAELAKHLKTTEPTVDRWMAEGMPVYQRGSNGRSYKFLTSEVRAWMLARNAAEKEEEERKAKAALQLQMELLGGDHNAEAEELYTPKQRREIYELDQIYRDMSEARGELVPRKDVDDLLDRIFSIVKKSINGMPDRLSRDAGLSGQQSEQAVTIADDILSQMHDELQLFADSHANEDAALVAAE